MPLEIVGPDAVRLLDRVFVCNVEALGIGRCRYALACNEDGTMVMDGVIMRLGPERYWYVKANGEFITWLRANAIGLDAEVSDPKSQVLQIQGPKSLDVLNAAMGGGLSVDFRYFRAGFFDLGGQILGIRRIEAGILDNGSDIEPDLTPFSAGLGHFVNFDKGDFVGRAALETADRSQLLFGLICPTAQPEADMAVHFNNAPVGHMTIGTWSPTLDTGVGYVRFDQPLTDDDWLGKTVLLQDQEVILHEATADLLPFIDKEKQLPRAAWGEGNQYLRRKARRARPRLHG